MPSEREARIRAAVDLLTTSGDVELEKIGHAARAFFFSPRSAPVTVDAESLARDVSAFSPTPFALAFARFRVRATAFDAAATSDDPDVNAHFDASFDQIWECWRQLVHFLPFVFLAALRLRDDLQQRGGKILARAFAQYEAFYRLSDNENETDRKKLEGQQCQLLENLIELCVDLGNPPAQPSSFFFNALLDTERDFQALFPKRFTIELKFIQSTRNRIEHGRVAGRPAEALRAVHHLIEVAFLDVVAVVVRLSRAYGIYDVDAIDETGATAIASATSFSGLDSSETRFALRSDDSGAASAEKFIPKHTYLIDRSREIVPGLPPLPLEPRDYVDLTPFIVERSRIDFSEVSAERRLYALDQYRSAERSRFIRFLELAGEALRRLPVSDKATDNELRELTELLEEIDDFSSRVESLADYILQRRRGKMDFPIVRRRAWERISKHHLDSVVDVRRIAYDGCVDAALGDVALASYDPEVYEPPAQARDVDEFFNSPKHGLLLIGGSGFGKTTLLASCFLERLRAGDVALFLSGRRLLKGTLKDIFADAASSIGYEWTLLDLENFVRDENAVRKAAGRPPAGVTIFIDAVNEYTAGGGASQLLRDIVEFVVTGGDKMYGRKLELVRLVATCRTETWTGYREAPQGVPFDRDSFYCSPAGEPIAVAGFDDDAMRRALYERYRRRYALERTPYESLSQAVSDLFRSPLMLALVAEAYGTRVPGQTGGIIPADLNYYSVFSRLKAKKLEACTFLVPPGARQEALVADLESCLLVFATLLYKRLTAKDDPRDYVGVEATARKPLSPFNTDRRDRQITTFRALREVGLVTSKVVSELGANFVEREGKAFTFFHDRYAEFELGAVYGHSVLGKMTREASRDPKVVKRVADEIEVLVRRAMRFPVLAGALDHWFAMTLNLNKGEVGALVPLCNRLSESASGSVRVKASGVLTGLMRRGSFGAKELYRVAIASGSPTLRVDLASSLGEAWPGVGPEAVAAFLDACNPGRDELAIETLADAFAEHANCEHRGGDGSSAVAFIARFFPDAAGLFGWLPDLGRIRSYLDFLVRFTLVTIVTCAERPAILSELQEFLVGRFQPLINFILGKPSGFAVVDWAPGPFRLVLRKLLERTMYAAWDDGISCEGANDTFFVADGGLVQRDAMLAYVPFMCAVHNRDYALLSLEDGSEFLERSLEMLNYRKYSIIGFAAYASITIAVRDDAAAVRRIVSNVMENGTAAGRFVAVNIVEAYCEVDRSFARDGLRMVEEMLPRLADDGDALSHLLVCAAGIVETNIPEHWSALVPSLDAAFAHLTARGNTDDILAFGREMRSMAFFGDSRIGTKFLDYLLAAGYLDADSEWRPAALEVCAGMAARDRVELQRLFSQYNVPDSALREAEALRTQAVLDQQRTFGTRARWNIFFIRALAFNPKLRYLLVKHMFCSIALCNEVAEWATQMGTFMIEAIRAYSRTDDDPSFYARLTPDDIYASTPFAPKPGKGKRYVPRRKAAGARLRTTGVQSG